MAPSEGKFSASGVQREDSKVSGSDSSVLKQLSKPADSDVSQYSQAPSDATPVNPYFVPDFDESKYEKEYAELREEAMKCKDLSYFPRCINGEDSSYSSSISSDSSYQSLIKRINNDITP